MRLIIFFDSFPPIQFEMAQTSSALIVPMETGLMLYIKGGEA